MKPPDQVHLGVIIVDEGRVCQQGLRNRSVKNLYLAASRTEKLAFRKGCEIKVFNGSGFYSS